MRHIKLISMNRSLFFLHLEVHEVVQVAVQVHHDPHVQGQAHGEAQEVNEAHQIDQHEQKFVLSALRSA
jgi:hypothetical protein